MFASAMVGGVKIVIRLTIERNELRKGEIMVRSQIFVPKTLLI